MNTEVKERTEADVLERAPVKVTLGGREYELWPRKGRKHTRRLREKLGGMLAQVDNLGDLIGMVVEKKVNKLDGEVLASIVPLIQKFIGPGMDELLDIVYDYCPAIEADRDFLEGDEDPDAGATDAEFFVALASIIGMTFGPFVQAFGLKLEKGASEN